MLRSSSAPAWLLFALAVSGVGLLGPLHTEDTRTRYGDDPLRWVIEQPEEIAAYAAFDPALVAGALPEGLRYVTLAEVASRWRAVREHVESNPEHAHFGISFVAIVRKARFTIGSRSPSWPEDGAVGQWWAYVDSADAPPRQGGIPASVLTLGLWVPDQAFVEYLREQGYFAEYGDVRLVREEDGVWRGSLRAPGVTAEVACSRADEERSLPGGQLTLLPPAGEATQGVTLRYLPYEERRCGAESRWQLDGEHPLAEVLQVGPSSWLAGFDMTSDPDTP